MIDTPGDEIEAVDADVDSRGGTSVGWIRWMIGTDERDYQQGISSSGKGAHATSSGSSRRCTID
jgi:hypothetical protein